MNEISKLVSAQGDLANSKIYADSALKLSESLNYKRGVAIAQNNLAVYYEITGNYIEAVKRNQMALKLRQELDDKKGIAGSLNNIGNIYLLQKNYPEAKKYYTEALELKKKYSTKKSLINGYINLGLVYFQTDDFDKALELYQSGLQVSQELENVNGMSNAYNNMGLVYEKKGNLELALKMYLDVLKVQGPEGEKAARAAVNVNLSAISLKLHNPDAAERYANEALRLSTEMGNIEYMKEAHLNLSECDSVKGDKKGQLENFELYIKYSDSLANIDKERVLAENQIKLDLAQKTASDSVKNELKKAVELAKNEQEIKQQKILTYGGLLGFAIMLVIAGISFRAFRQKQKDNLLISEQKLIVEEQQKSILDSIQYAKRIQTSLLPTEKYIQRSINRLNGKNLTLLLLFCSPYLFAQKNLDSLEKLSATTTDDSLRFELFVKLGKGNSITNPDKALSFAEKALGMAKKEKNLEKEATAYRVFGTCYYYSEQMYDAIDYYTKSLEIVKTLDDPKSLATNYRNVSICYTQLGKTEKAAELLFISLKLADANNDSALLTNLYNDLGGIYFHQNNLERAREYYSNSYRIAKAKNNLLNMATAMNNIASIYATGLEYSQALVCYQESMELRKKVGDTLGLVSSYTNIAQIYALRKEYNKSLDFNLQAVKIANMVRYEPSMAYANLCLASTYRDMKNYPKAIEHGLASLKLNAKVEDPRKLSEVEKQLYTIYKEAGQPDKAMVHYRQYLHFNDLGKKQEMSKEIFQAQLQYDHEKKQTADSIANVQVAKMQELDHQQKVAEQRNYTYGGAIGFTLMLIVSAVSFRAYRQKRKDTLLISEQKAIVEERQKDILASIQYAKRIQTSLLPTEKYIDGQLRRLLR